MDLGALQQQLSDFLNSDAVQLFFRAVLIYIVLIWLATAFWAYRDMQQRTTNPIAPYLAAALIIVFTPIAFLFAYFLYRIVRPKETVSEANERALAEEAMLVEIESQPHCANCSRPVHEEWIICPTCRNRLRRVCPNCSRLVELDWSLCAYCGKDFERPDTPNTAYMPQGRSSRRRQAVPQPMPPQPMPAPMYQEQAPMLQAPPPTLGPSQMSPDMSGRPVAGER
jgi:RNA polymerase subunit RPABC4/transcription elongation factor Spt4